MLFKRHNNSYTHVLFLLVQKEWLYQTWCDKASKELYWLKFLKQVQNLKTWLACSPRNISTVMCCNPYMTILFFYSIHEVLMTTKKKKISVELGVNSDFVSSISFSVIYINRVKHSFALICILTLNINVILHFASKKLFAIIF